MSMLEEKNGSYIYSKPGGYPVAVTEYDFERIRTLEVNQALRDLVAACDGEAYEPSGIFGLRGRSKKVFGEVVRERLQPCYQKVRRHYEEARLQAIKSRQKVTLSDIADDVSIEDDDENPGTHISNENVGEGDASFSVGSSPAASAGYDHLAEYLVRSKRIIEDECLTKWGDDKRSVQGCVGGEMNAVESLRARPTTVVPPNAFIRIRNGCKGRYLRDYSLRNSCEVKEIRFYESIQRKMRDPGFSFQVLQEIRDACVLEWPDSVESQAGCMDQLMEAARYSTPD